MLLYGDVAIPAAGATAKGDGGEQEAPETKDAEVPGVERIAADAREVLRGGVVLPETAAGGGVPEGKEGGTVDRGEEPGVGADPAEVLDPEPGAVGGGLRVEPEEDLAGSEVPKGDAALAVTDGEAEVGVRGVVEGGEVAGEGLGAPADGCDEGGEGVRGGGGGGGGATDGGG